MVEPEIGIADLAPPRARANRNHGQLRMLYVGRIVRTKGLRDAIRALARLSDLPDLTLDVAGEGEDLEACRREAGELGVSSRVRFLGRLPPAVIDRLYHQADLFLFPSFREPTGIVLFEAMRHGLPIVTTNIGGPGYIVDDECGFRVPALDPEQFAQDLAGAIRRLTLDESLLAAFGQGARTRVCQIGLWENKMDRIISLYSDIITNKNGINPTK